MTPSPKLTPLLEYLEGLDRCADLGTLRRLLADLEATRADLAPFVRFSDRQYARNLVRKTPWFEMVSVCWKAGQATPIHDHKGSSCAFLVIEGAAVETQFARTPRGRLGEARGPFIREVGYICASSEHDIHEVRNDGPADLITLHIYSPALANLNIYDPKTRRAQAWAPDVVEA